VPGDLETRRLAQARAQFVAALGRADTDALAALYAPDAMLLPPSAEPVSGRAAIRRFWQAGVAAGIVAIRHEAVRLGHDTRLSYEVGRYELRLEPPGSKTIVDRGNYVVVHCREDDSSWRRSVEIFAPATFLQRASATLRSTADRGEPT
jgi:ketosteroid isomerase-like protein